MDVTRERWQRIEAVFDAVADLPDEAQDAALAEACAGDAALEAEVRRLLAHDRTHGARVAAVLDGVARLPPTGEPAGLDAGRRIGPYRVVRELGSGGMGVVYEAARNDDFQQRAAIKVAGRAAFSPELSARFRDERQILARLTHPHIARLLDGGTTDDGVPWFAMEFVEGEPLDRFVAARQPDLAARLALFLQVCDAVEYAHQNLVVHRDLKPANILVADGAARLLDFGVAKLLGTSAPGDRSQTRGGLAPVTPDYCSPEQLRSEAVTTRTDVYMLGLVLYELLTGERGQRADTTSPLALERSICEAAVPPPSQAAVVAGTALARRLRGDLDTIVATATQKDPARRYHSVAALADDVRRHLDGQPILARIDSPWYRARRFARRQWLPLTATAVLVASLLAGVVATTYQARRAERRFQEVRGIANALMNEVHPAIQDLPSSTAAQQTVLSTAVNYLDGLAREAGDDRALQLEIARGYLKASEMAYSVERGSLGRVDEGQRYLDRAALLLAPFEAATASDPAVAAATVMRYRLAANLAVEQSRRDVALQTLRRGYDIGSAALQNAPNDIPLNDVVHDTLVELLSSYSADAWVAALLPRLVALAEHRMTLQPGTPDAQAQLAVTYSQAGTVAAALQDRAAARRHYQRAVELQSGIVAGAPDNATARRNLMIALANVADMSLGPLSSSSSTGSGGPPMPLADADRQVASAAYARAFEQASWLRERDPGNDTALFDYAVCRGRMAPTFAVGDPGAITALSDALAQLRALADRHPARVAAYEIEFRGSLAERHRQHGAYERADAEWARIDVVMREALARDPENYYFQRLALPMFQNQALSFAARGRRSEALRAAARVAQLADVMLARANVYARGPGWPPRARAWLADLHDRLGDPAAAAKARAESREMWRAVATRSGLPADVLKEAREQSPP